MLRVMAKAKEWKPVRIYPKNYVGTKTFILRLV